MYQALVERDGSYEGIFVACVRTTRIFCRPTCSAKKPKPQNVEFLPTAADALRAGYRPCRVCRPLDFDGALPAWVEELIDDMMSKPARRISDAMLRRRGIAPDRARRHFQAHFGMTFHGYQRAIRLGHAFGEIRSGAAIQSAAFGNGYGSDSGFRDAFSRLFGDPPGRAAAAEVEPLLAQWWPTPLGPMVAAASARGLCLLEFVDRRALPTEIELIRRTFQAPVLPGRNEHLDRTRVELDRYFAERFAGRGFSAPLDLRGTPFQMSVWHALRTIPIGETRSYAQIANEIGAPAAVRAVGRANGHNRIAIIIPCHRVIGADGRLTGYGGGLWRKKWLLDHETRQ